MPMSLKMTGIPEARTRLNAVQQAVRDDATRKALRAGGGVILGAMESLAPVLDQRTSKSTALPPGALKTGLRLTIKKLRDGYMMAIIGPGASVSHVARWLEYGHRLVKGGYSKVTAKGLSGAGREIGHVPAHAFIRPAADESAQKAIEVFARTLESGIRGVLD